MKRPRGREALRRGRGEGGAGGFEQFQVHGNLEIFLSARSKAQISTSTNCARVAPIFHTTHPMPPCSTDTSRRAQPPPPRRRSLRLRKRRRTGEVGGRPASEAQLRQLAYLGLGLPLRSSPINVLNSWVSAVFPAGVEHTSLSEGEAAEAQMAAFEMEGALDRVAAQAISQDNAFLLRVVIDRVCRGVFRSATTFEGGRARACAKQGAEFAQAVLSNPQLCDMLPSEEVLRLVVLAENGMRTGQPALLVGRALEVAACAVLLRDVSPEQEATWVAVRETAAALSAADVERNVPGEARFLAHRPSSPSPFGFCV